MVGHLLDVHGQRRRPAAQSLRTGAQTVDALKQFALHVGQHRIIRRRAAFARQAVLGHLHGALRRAADSRAHHNEPLTSPPVRCTSCPTSMKMTAMPVS